jgi:hypothetical protein
VLYLSGGLFSRSFFLIKVFLSPSVGFFVMYWRWFRVDGTFIVADVLLLILFFLVILNIVCLMSFVFLNLDGRIKNNAC